MAKTAGIILVGNEILSGKIQDANAAYLCRELRALGVEVRRIAVIPDEVDLIAHEVAAFSADYDLVFTSGGVGPTHDDVTIEGVARALGVDVVRHPTLVALLERYYQGKVTLTDAHLKMAEVPAGAELVSGETVRFPTILARNVWVLPGVPEIFRQKFDAVRERFRDEPIHLANVYVSLGEGTLADYLNGLLHDFPRLLLGSYPEFSNPEYRVKVTLESRDRAYLDAALAEFLKRLPADAVVRVG
jgi:molybdenum cofactor synthesis domain-containing protein